MGRMIEYLHFYYNFTRYDAYAGDPCGCAFRALSPI
jgi:hypothetical protein